MRTNFCDRIFSCAHLCASVGTVALFFFFNSLFVHTFPCNSNYFPSNISLPYGLMELCVCDIYVAEAHIRKLNLEPNHVIVIVKMDRISGDCICVIIIGLSYAVVNFQH